MSEYLKLADEAAATVREHKAGWVGGVLPLVERLEQAVRELVVESEHRYQWAMAQQKLADESRLEVDLLRIALANKEELADSWRRKCLAARGES